MCDRASTSRKRRVRVHVRKTKTTGNLMKLESTVWQQNLPLESRDGSAGEQDSVLRHRHDECTPTRTRSSGTKRVLSELIRPVGPDKTVCTATNGVLKRNSRWWLWPICECEKGDKSQAHRVSTRKYAMRTSSRQLAYSEEIHIKKGR